MSGAMATSSIHQQQSSCSLLLLDPWPHGGTKDSTSQACSWVPQGIRKATDDPVCVLACVHMILYNRNWLGTFGSTFVVPLEQTLVINFHTMKLVPTFQRLYSSRKPDPWSLLPNIFSEYDQFVKPSITLIS